MTRLHNVVDDDHVTQLLHYGALFCCRQSFNTELEDATGMVWLVSGIQKFQQPAASLVSLQVVMAGR